MTHKIIILICFVFAIFSSCNSQTKQKNTNIDPATAVSQVPQEKEKMVIMQTEFGTIKLKLYNGTPGHRDNFIKLVKSGFYNERIFHRVIKAFMVQGGNPEFPVSKKVVGKKDSFEYTIPAEINRQYIHKRGALAAARTADQVNPERRSSGTQFYIVTGKVSTPEELQQMETSITNSILQKKYNDICMDLAKNQGMSQEQIQKIAYQKVMEQQYLYTFKFTPDEIKTYTTIGGTPFLDQNYTVFGEVVEGMDVVEKIEQQQTNPQDDKPVKDIKFSIQVIE